MPSLLPAAALGDVRPYVGERVRLFLTDNEMCGRFVSQLPPELMRRVFAIMGDIPDTPASWNVAPTQDVLVLRRHPVTGERRLDALRWGLVPHVTKDLSSCKRPINARAETMAGTAMFRSALRARRCLVPADAF